VWQSVEGREARTFSQPLAGVNSCEWEVGARGNHGNASVHLMREAVCDEVKWGEGGRSSCSRG
jgi:hypothetical protein